jgi:hypothetical protein
MKNKKVSFVILMLLTTTVVSISATPITEIQNYVLNNKGISLQSGSLLFEGFEDGVMPPPSGWYLDESNPDYGWFIGNLNVYNGSFCGWMNFDNANEKDNWLISPDIDSTGFSSLYLSFWGKSDTNYPGATVEVHIKGNGFDDVVWDLIEDEYWDLFDWYNVNVDISSYAGKTINVSWRYIGIGGESFGLDDIRITSEIGGSNLVCTGSLTWNDVEPSEIVNGTFNVVNTGSQGSNLNWEIVEYPNWGTWTFVPLHGENLGPEDGSVKVEVSVIAPDQKNTNFTGHITVVNKDNPVDFEIIQISLITPTKSNPYFTILEERFPRIYDFLSNILLRI